MGSRIAVVGGGAAGFFAAIACAEADRGASVVLLEKGRRFLSKVLVSGGGRCNVTHACFDPALLAEGYPRGGKELLGPFRRFQPRDTIDWFAARGVRLKTEADGRVFPVTDSSQTIVDCLGRAARDAGVCLRSNSGVGRIRRRENDGFTLSLADGGYLECDRLLLATGGCRAGDEGDFAASLGHTIESPVPSLFTFHSAEPWVRRLAGVAADPVEVSLPGTRLRESGPLLLTHSGLSGPSILRLSAWGARLLSERGYRCAVRVNWLPDLGPAELELELQALQERHSARQIGNAPPGGLPSRLWIALAELAGVDPGSRWSALSRKSRNALAAALRGTDIRVAGKSLNKEEFVTCGGVRLGEVDFKTMESRVCPGLYLAGELLDIDGITGGFNFQSAWTTGWIAGRAMASVSSPRGG
jgi:predicted Rossmann fold flavoprotein